MKSDDELKKENPLLYHVARENGTEPAFAGRYIHTEEKGMYKCAVCSQELFHSDTKFDSGSGWPSFYDAIVGAIKTKEDNAFGMSRIEVVCSQCGAHLGHVFNDAPQTPTGHRYCINGICLDMEEKEKDENN